METQSALGPALQAGFKLLSPTGGRMTVFQTQLPTVGAGALKPREEPSAKVCKPTLQNLGFNKEHLSVAAQNMPPVRFA